MTPIDDNDLTHADFDCHWKCCCRQTDDYPDDFIESLSDDDSKVVHRWSSVTLPHVVKPSTQEDQNASDRCDWWYRKHFDWLLPDEQQHQRVHLLFESSSGEYHSETLNIIATIWFNGEKILSDTLLSQQKPIDLTHELRRAYESKKKNKLHNVLIVRCANASLSLHAHLLVHGTMFWPSTPRKHHHQRTSHADQSSLKDENNAFDYAVRINGSDRRISVAYTQAEEEDEASLAPFSPSPSGSSVDDSQTREKENDAEDLSVPRLAILILIVGTRGDVQPFIALGKELLSDGHRVRLATHEVFRSFVRENGLEFYPLAGNPAELMSFMVKNAGIIPSMSSIVAGDVAKHRHILSEILESTWLACTAHDDETRLPFTAEAIIANPPSFGHVHCAEKLQIPLHMMFTMPWTPTTVFPHPLCNIESSRGPTGRINFYSYHVVEMLTWSGMRGIINHFRREILGLPSLRVPQATNFLIDERVPHTYCWSPSLVAKPPDWESHVDVSGFFFLDLCTNYDAPPELLDFLGISQDHPDEHTLPLPIYIGFGSITGHDSRRLLKVVLDALDQTGYRAVLSGLATEADTLPSNVFQINNVPHDWLFQHVRAVCHHGGAGTTAAGLRAGKPTIIVPFFGDQFFWGNVVEKSGAGPHPLPGRSITASELAAAFDFTSQPATRAAAERIRDAILKENGCQAAVRSFHAHLPLARMRSHLQPTFGACYRVDGLNLQISRPVAHALIAAGVIDGSHLRSHSTREWQCRRDRKSHAALEDTIEEKQSRSRTVVDDDAQSRLSSNSGCENTSPHTSIHSSPSVGSMIKTPNGLSSLSRKHSELNVSKHRTTFKSTVQSIYNVRKVALLNFLKRSGTGHEELGASCPTAHALIATTKYAMQPAVCSIPTSPSWFGELSPKAVDAVVPAKTQGETSAVIQAVAAASGFHPEICEQILREFDQIRSARERAPLTSRKSVSNSTHRPPFQRQRSRSTSELL